jgi:regulator of sigma E protease
MGSRCPGADGMIDGIINVVLLLAVLTGLVLVHELGHFVTARRAGVKVHEFGIGFPPRAKVLFKRGDTTYTLNWLPIGGFVRLEGEEASPADGSRPEGDEAAAPRGAADGLPERESLDPRAFVNQPLRTRLVILFAGVAVNFVLAWVIFALIAFVAQPTWKVQLADVTPGSPAEAVGLVGGQVIEQREIEVIDADGNPTGEFQTVDIFDDSGDTILAIDGRTFPVFDDMSNADAADGRIAPIKYLADRPGETVTLTIERADGTSVDVEATLRSAEEIAAGEGALGFRPGQYSFGEQQNGPLDSVVIGLRRTVETSTLILRAVGGLIVSIFDGPDDALDDIAGPVGMIDIMGQVRVAFPPVFLLWFVGLLSANLAVINLLPIPPLDGSRMVMGVVQAVSGNRVSPEAERLVYFTGWLALMAFLIWVTISDIGRLTS